VTELRGTGAVFRHLRKKLSTGIVELDVGEVLGKGTAVKEGEARLLCAHMHARLRGVTKQFAKTSFQPLPLCQSPPNARVGKDTEAEASSPAAAQREEEMSSGHGLCIVKAERLSASVPTFHRITEW